MIEEAIEWLLNKVQKEGQELEMSKQYPECPLYNHNNCKEIHNRKLCALVREDKICLKKIPKLVKEAKKITRNREVAID